MRANRLCVMCRARRPLFRYRGVVKADADHTLCFQCYRALKNSVRFVRRWWPPVAQQAPGRMAKEMQ